MMKRDRRALIMVLAAAVCVACAATRGRLLASDADTAIRAEMDRTAAAWNAADIAGHVSAYTESATMMFSRGPEAGRDTIAARLKRGFWRDDKPVQQLRFESIVVRPLGRDHALVTGRFVLSGGGQAERSGWYSLVWQRVSGRWMIIHDHST